MSITTLPRKFHTSVEGERDVLLDDPNPEMTPQEVIEFYSGRYPELTNSTIVGPTIVDDHLRYDFKVVLGTKG